MRLRKIEENKKVKCEYYYDFINCGECYLLTDWHNTENATVTLNKDTVLEDLHEKHGGSIRYSKLCKNTFRVYESMNRGWRDKDLDEVLSWTMIDSYDRDDYVPLLRALITGEGMEELISVQCIVRSANEGSSRGIDWYRLIDD